MNMPSYTPSQEMIDKYADVLVNFALNEGEGLRPGEVVYVWGKEVVKPLYVAVCNAVWKAGGHVLDGYLPDESVRRGALASFYKHASDEQLDYFPEKFYRGFVDQIDHQISLIGEADLHYMADVEPAKLMRYGKTMMPYLEWRDAKENAGKFSWTLALYGTEAQAAEAGMTLEEYWGQIVKACFLDSPDPVAEMRKTIGNIHKIRDALNELDIASVHVKADDVDLTVVLGDKRRWVGGTARNIPSFEIFTSPDHRGTEGYIAFNEPLYYNGQLITGIELWFEGGKVVKSQAAQGEAALKEMIATEGADGVGEFSLTDSRISKIDRFMATTLYDENRGGRYGNTHIALGSSYHDCYAGDIATATAETWKELGFNASSVHTDMFSTTDRTVTATLADGSQKVIYEDGKFTVGGEL